MALLPFVDDPAKIAAAKTKADLEKLKRPLPDNLIPKELDEIARQNAVAQAAWKAAEREIDRLQVQNEARAERIALLENLIAKAEEVRHIWCVTYSTDLAGEVDTLEVPGFWQDEGEMKLVTLFEGKPNQRNVIYREYLWNIAPQGKANYAVGQMQYADGLSDASVFYNAAMEPGHLRWKPIWRYATLTADASLIECNVNLIETEARHFRREQKLPINGVVTTAPISYVPCRGSVFKQGDEVVVTFGHYDWGVPVVVGFRRKPKTCSGSAWRQLR